MKVRQLYIEGCAPNDWPDKPWTRRAQHLTATETVVNRAIQEFGGRATTAQLIERTGQEEKIVNKGLRGLWSKRHIERRTDSTARGTYLWVVKKETDTER